METIKTDTSLKKIEGVGKKFIKKLHRLDLYTAGDLLWHFPNRYEDYSEKREIAELQESDNVTIHGTVTDINIRKTYRRKMIIVEVTISDETESIQAVWFNQPYLKETLKPGTEVNISGEVEKRKGSLQFSNPIYEKIEPSDTPTHTERIIPVYSETKGLTSRGLRFLIEPILENIELKETLPEFVIEEQNLPEIKKALEKIHFPETQEDINEARRRFTFEDLFMLQLHNLKAKKEIEKRSAYPIDIDMEFLKKDIENLPYDLTDDQRKSLYSMTQDLQENYPMNRLLQGDVGSGKTVVAILAAMQVAYNGYQAAFMAPTEILATQHYNTFKRLFPYFEEGVGLLTGSKSEIYYGDGLVDDLNKKELYKRLKRNKVKVVIGTHALIQKKVKFEKLGFTIIDEQHRFGVKQRAKLAQNENDDSGNEILPHFLSMSATPIPRTLSLTVFNDLDMSKIMELPGDRKPVETKLVPPSKRQESYEFIRNEIKKGRQVFVICPQIDSEEGKSSKWDGVKAVRQEHKKLSEKVFPKLSVGMLHGKMTPEEKNDTMKRFAEDKEINLLVSTSVIEVGIDIPNATIMMIEGAERFGLSQLYQFQGRVGRGEHQSYCFLFTNSENPKTLRRLNYLVEADDGLELAERDLQIRGPGEFLGKSQSGMPDLAMKAIKNPQLIKTTKEAAEKLFEKGLDDYPGIRTRLNQFETTLHRE